MANWGGAPELYLHCIQLSLDRSWIDRQSHIVNRYQCTCNPSISRTYIKYTPSPPQQSRYILAYPHLCPSLNAPENPPTPLSYTFRKPARNTKIILDPFNPEAPTRSSCRSLTCRPWKKPAPSRTRTINTRKSKQQTPTPRQQRQPHQKPNESNEQRWAQ